jgi:alpha-maltose-1-phosphate synthase
MSSGQTAALCDHGKVTVSHPSRVLVAYQSALALEEAQLLRHFETGFSYKAGGLLTSLLTAMPNSFKGRLERELLRRHEGGIATDRVRCHPFWDHVFTAAAKFGVWQSLTDKLMFFRNERFDGAVARHLLRCRPEVVIGYDTSSLKAFRAAKKVGARCILDQVIGHIAVGVPMLHEEQRLHPEWADSVPSHAAGAEIIDRCIAEAHEADSILAASEYVRDTLVTIGVRREKIFLLPYGVDVQRFRPPAEKRSASTFRALFVGQISQRKGIKYLLEAWKRLALPDAELVILGSVVGQGEGLRRYEGLFRHLPSVPYSELHTYYQDADIFIFPSVHEGSALAVNEAMASGLPVITTHNSGTPVRDGQEGFIVPIRDIDALAQRIQQLYSDRLLVQRMGENARRRIEQFTWQAYRRNLVEHLRTFLNASQPPLLSKR